jgi:hypothetical protein
MMLSNEKQKLILECTKVMAPLMYPDLKTVWHMETLVNKCVAAGTMMAAEIIKAETTLDKFLENNANKTESKQ